MQCPYCGFEDPEDMAFCAECGRSLRSAPGPDPRADAARVGGHDRAESAAGASWAGPASGAVLPAGHSPHLVGLEGPVEGIDYVLNKPQVGIGRLPDCDISVPAAGVSRLHAWIRSTPGGYIIEDGGSANGTWVNGVQAAPSLPLAEHDVIRIGPCSFVFQLEEPRALPPGSMTMVSDVGEEPSPFGDDRPDRVEHPPDRSPTPPFPPSPWPAASSADARAASGTAPTPSATPSVSGEGGPLLQQQVGDLRDALLAALQSLDRLAGSVGGLEARAAEAQSAPLRTLRQAVLDDPVARDAPDRYRELQALLGKLQVAPTDLKLLLQLSDQIPTLRDIVEAYLRLLTTVRDLARQ